MNKACRINWEVPCFGRCYSLTNYDLKILQAIQKLDQVGELLNLFAAILNIKKKIILFFNSNNVSCFVIANKSVTKSWSMFCAYASERDFKGQNFWAWLKWELWHLIFHDIFKTLSEFLQDKTK